MKASVIAVITAVTSAEQQLGWCFDRNGLASDFKEIEGTKNWPTAFEFNLQTLDTCWVESKQSSYISWEWNEQVTITTEKYGFNPEEAGKCKEIGAKTNFYAKNTIEYTSRSPWPYNENDICATYIKIRNDDKDRESQVTFHTFPDGYTEDPSPLGATQIGLLNAITLVGITFIL